MKKVLRTFGIASIVLSVCFLVSACSKDTPVQYISMGWYFNDLFLTIKNEEGKDIAGDLDVLKNITVIGMETGETMKCRVVKFQNEELGVFVPVQAPNSRKYNNTKLEDGTILETALVIRYGDQDIPVQCLFHKSLKVETIGALVGPGLTLIKVKCQGSTFSVEKGAESVIIPFVLSDGKLVAKPASK
ncbi:MAG: hypothetical protein SOW44_01655 [Porphyromonas sp.]|nr:hypothetical protein [Bacteroidales bacterium]MDY3100039.1 hypothetical protein [Porphyromonas sp.]